MTTMLSDTEKIVLETIRMRLSTEQALHHMKDCGFPVSRATYFRYKKKVEKNNWEDSII